jgi:GTP cyclohydrolase I
MTQPIAVSNPIWEDMMGVAVREMLKIYGNSINSDHLEKTPERVVAAFKEYFSGCFVDTEQLLTSALFEAQHNQMIIMDDIYFHSVCAHHLALVSGKAIFAYVPKGKIVGISKIPRLIDAFARRPQIQEDMSDQIVDCFMENVKPAGCAISVVANHACVQVRGSKSHASKMTTTSLRGVFSTNSDTRLEFQMAVRGQ